MDDVIVLTASVTEYRYRVMLSRVMSPNDVAVLDPSGGNPGPDASSAFNGAAIH